ncbi:MAG TPA: SDR family oxidoreductase [Chloroflexi bacterium]|nr:SDR family oxidoreductase [Chloroflexota bacterium]
MNALFIGGTGVISSACVRRALAQGIELYVLNRGQTAIRPLPDGVKILPGDIRDPASVETILGALTFDVVVDWVAFVPEHIETDLRLFRGRTGQYVFISSASAYRKPLPGLPITESTPLDNPYWQYSRDKIACEERLLWAYREEKFPVTIVRPSHTYDCTKLPFYGKYTALDRMRNGEKVIVHGDGNSLWVLTHHTDFAKGFVGLLANSRAVGDVFHITSDEVLTWDQIYRIVARAAGVAEPRLVHVPSELIAAYDPERGPGLLGDKAHSVIFDNSKIKRVVPDYVASIPFSRGAKEIVAWYDADPARRTISAEDNRLFDRIITAYESAWPGD